MASFASLTMSSMSFGFAAAFMAASVLLVGCGGGGSGGGGNGSGSGNGSGDGNGSGNGNGNGSGSGSGITLPYTFTKDDEALYEQQEAVKVLSNIMNNADYLDATDSYVPGPNGRRTRSTVQCDDSSCSSNGHNSISLDYFRDKSNFDIYKDNYLVDIELSKIQSYSNFYETHVSLNDEDNIKQSVYEVWGSHGYFYLGDGGAFFFGSDKADSNPDMNLSYKGPVRANYNVNSYTNVPENLYSTGTASLDMVGTGDPKITVRVKLTDNCNANCDFTWNNISLINGQFEDDNPANQHSISGALFGPNHEEAYGVFHGPYWLGGFAAEKQ